MRRSPTVLPYGLVRHAPAPDRDPNDGNVTKRKTTSMIRIGTRGSFLALAQANDVARRLKEAHGLGDKDVSIVEIRTSGDRIQDRPLSEVGGKWHIKKEKEEAVMGNRNGGGEQ